jgi:hypothetical protein
VQLSLAQKRLQADQRREARILHNMHRAAKGSTDDAEAGYDVDVATGATKQINVGYRQQVRIRIILSLFVTCTLEKTCLYRIMCFNQTCSEKLGKIAD